MPDRLVLALDGSTNVCSVALLSPAASPRTTEAPGWRVEARRAEGDGRSQARVLLRLIDEMLREVGGGPADLSGIVVGTGPGTFTGVRITVATARALSLALDIPVVGVSTLAGLAAAVAAGGEEGGELLLGTELLLPVVDARRGQLFYAIYHRCAGDDGGRWVRQDAYGVCDRGAIPTLAQDLSSPGRVLVVGDSSLLPAGGSSGRVDAVALAVDAEWLVRGQERLEEPGDTPAGTRLGPFLRGALAAAPGALEDVAGRRRVEAGGGSRFEPGTAGSPESVKPIYVRPPDADVHITKMRDPWSAR